MKENLNIELLNNFGDCSEDGHRLFSNVGSRASALLGIDPFVLLKKDPSGAR